MQLAPGAIREIFDDNKSQIIWAKGRSKILGRMRSIKLDGVVTHSLMTAFSAKLGMALFREHVGRPMSAGGVYTQFYFNAGLTRGIAKSTLDILPLVGQLQQGKQYSGRQFNYRYNCDERSITAVFAAFHDNLFVRAIAVEDAETYSFLIDEYNSGFVSFGGLREISHAWSS
ncbi:hypothetical protein [Sphingorhabdus arenilitoris]